jgi:hypothetical protein
MIKGHVLLSKASMLEEVNLSFRALLTSERVRNIVSLIPDEWLNMDSHFIKAEENREAYIQFLESRLKNSDLFVKEAQDARQSLI